MKALLELELIMIILDCPVRVEDASSGETNPATDGDRIGHGVTSQHSDYLRKRKL